VTSNDSREVKLQQVISVKGIAGKSATLFIDNIEPFVAFMKESNLEYKLLDVSNKTPVDKTSELYQKTIVMTGFRDNQILDFLKLQGAIMGSSVSKNTYLVIVKTMDDTTSKSDQAVEKGIPIMDKATFLQKYMS
jgi:NAD-dependent DNA ligase